MKEPESLALQQGAAQASSCGPGIYYQSSMPIFEGGITMQRVTKVLSVAGPLLAVLLSCGVQQLRAQSPVWTQIPLPNATSCYTPQESPSSAAPSHCDWGNSPESIGAGYSATLNNPGVGNTAGGVYI